MTDPLGSPPQDPHYQTPYPPQPGVYGRPQPQTYGAPARPYVPPTSAVQPYASPSYAPQPYAPQPYAPQPYAAQPYPVAAAGTWAAAHPQYRLVAPGGRLGAALLDLGLAVVTLWIGWFVWTMIVWSGGQTPGKQLLGHVVADVHDGRPFDWGRMFVRDFAIRGLLFGVLNFVTAGIFGIVDACFVFGKDHRTLHDQMAGSIVRYADV